MDEEASKISSAADTSVASKFILKPPKGMQDFEPSEMIKRDWVLHTIESVFKKHAVDKLDTPVMERKEILYAKASEETTKQIYDIVERGVHEEDDDEDELGDAGKETEKERLSLRFDLTVSLARYIAQRNIRSFARYQFGKVYRGENVSKSKGRYREFMQFDFDIVGMEIQDFPDIRTIMILAEIFMALSLTPSFSIFLNHRVLLRAIMTISGVPLPLQQTCCTSIDKLDKAPWMVVADELSKKGVPTDAITKLEKVLNPDPLNTSQPPPLQQQPTCPLVPDAHPSTDPPPPVPDRAAALHMSFLATLSKIRSCVLNDPIYTAAAAAEDATKKKTDSEATPSSAAPPTVSPSYTEVVAAFDTLTRVFTAVDSHPLLPKCLCFSPCLARGHDYYTGLIFEGCFRCPAQPSSRFLADFPNARPGESMGTSVGGGRYDSLIGILSPAMGTVPAIGFGLGFERLVSLVGGDKLHALGLVGGGGVVKKADVMVAPLGFDKQAVGSDAVLRMLFRVEGTLVSQGLRVELWKGTNTNPKQVIPECCRLGIPVLVQFGQSEIDGNCVVVKKVEETKKLKPGQQAPKIAVAGDAAGPVVLRLDDPALIPSITAFSEEVERDARVRMEEEATQREIEEKERGAKEAKKREKDRRRDQAKIKATACALDDLPIEAPQDASASTGATN